MRQSNTPAPELSHLCSSSQAPLRPPVMWGSGCLGPELSLEGMRKAAWGEHPPPREEIPFFPGGSNLKDFYVETDMDLMGSRWQKLT